MNNSDKQAKYQIQNIQPKFILRTKGLAPIENVPDVKACLIRLINEKTTELCNICRNHALKTRSCGAESQEKGRNSVIE